MGITKIAKAVAASVETRHISASASAYIEVITSDGFDMNSPCKYAVKHPNGGGGVWMMWAEEVATAFIAEAPFGVLVAVEEGGAS